MELWRVLVAEGDEGKLRREIGFLGFAAITINGLIGGGIFALPGRAIESAGAFSAWLFLIIAVLFLTIVLSFAQAASRFRQTGGPSVYVGHAFGSFAGFQTGWLLLVGRISAMAANTLVMVTYAAWFWPALDDGLVRHLAVAAVIVALTLVNCAGVRNGLMTVIVLTVLKLIPLSVVILVGLQHLDPGTLFGASLPEPSSLGETTLMLFYAFIGFEGGVINAGEGKDPQRDIPRAIVRTVGFTALLYFAIQWVAISVPAEAITTERPLVGIANSLMGPLGAKLLTLGAVLSIGGNLSSTMISAPRMSYALARDRCLPAWLGRVHSEHATPIASILFVGGTALVLALTGTFKYLAIMSTLARLLGYMLCIASIPRLPDSGGIRLPGGWTVPIFAFLCCGVLVTQATSGAWLTMLGFIAGGTLLYTLARPEPCRGDM